MAKYKGKKSDEGFVPNFSRLKKLLNAWEKGQLEKESDPSYTGTKIDFNDNFEPKPL